MNVRLLSLLSIKYYYSNLGAIYAKDPSTVANVVCCLFGLKIDTFLMLVVTKLICANLTLQ